MEWMAGRKYVCDVNGERAKADIITSKSKRQIRKRIISGIGNGNMDECNTDSECGK